VAKKKEWKLVRLEDKTVERLRLLVEGWQATEWEGMPYGDRCQWTSHVSIDAIVQILLDREMNHRKRSNPGKAPKTAPEDLPG